MFKPRSDRMALKVTSLSGRSSTIRMLGIFSADFYDAHTPVVSGERLAMQPQAEHREQVVGVDGLGDIVRVPASMHFSRSPFIALAVSAMIGSVRNFPSVCWPGSCRSRPSCGIMISINTTSTFGCYHRRMANANHARIGREHFHVVAPTNWSWQRYSGCHHRRAARVCRPGSCWPVQPLDDGPLFS